MSAPMKIDLHETWAEMQRLLYQEMALAGRCDTKRWSFEMHPETLHEYLHAFNDWDRPKFLTSGAVEFDGIPIEASLGVRRGVIRLVIGAVEGEAKRVPRLFDDEQRRTKP